MKPNKVFKNVPFFSFNCYKIVGFVLAIFVAGSAYSTHIVGGEITYEHLSGSQYEITLKIYRDCGPDNTMGTGFDSPAYIGVYVNNQLQQTLSADFFSAVVSNIPATIDNECLVIPEGVCIEECIYIVLVDLPQSASGYDLVYVRCCRNPGIINLFIPEDQGMTCSTHITGSNDAEGVNSSARFVNLPPALFCANFPFEMDHSATDPDGDSLVYEFCEPLHGAAPLDPQPLPFGTWVPINVTFDNPYTFDFPIESSPAFQIDPQTGIFTGTATVPGKWVYAICVKEYRDGELINTVRRDYMIRILNCAEITTAVIPFIEPCQGLDIQFENNSINATEFHWDFGVEDLITDTSSLAEPFFAYPDTGLYTITFWANPGEECGDSVSFELAVYEPIELQLELEDSYCANGMMNFDFSVSGTYSNEATFNWIFPPGSVPANSTLENPGVFGSGNTGSYNVTLNLDDHNCELSEIFPVEIPELPSAGIEVTSDPCEGLTIEFESNSVNAVSYDWDFGDAGINDDSSQENPQYTYSDYGNFYVTLEVENEAGCTDIDTLEVGVFSPNPLVMAYEYLVPIPCGGDSLVQFEFTGFGNTSVLWDLGDGTQSSDEIVNHTYNEAGEYTIELTIYNSLCDVEESVSFDVLFDDQIPDLDIMMPNIITPNKDLKNDLLLPFDPLEEIKLPEGRTIFDYLFEYSLKTYDRWGVLMFESIGNEGWNGLNNGKEVKEGVYYYIITYRDVCNKELISRDGHFHIVRD